MNVLVTGAAGYIGSVVSEKLIAEGNTVFALDNLQQGHGQAVAPEAVFIKCDLSDVKEVDRIFSQYKQIDAVIHLAADSSVENSIADPGRYFQNNVINSLNLLDVMLKYGVNKLVFSSSASVYGQPLEIPVEESAQTVPVSPYGESKLMFERILYWYGQAYQLASIALRYFNVAGATLRFGEDHRPETHLVANVIKVALGQIKHVQVFGTDYPTRDGTCIRDYIHVSDIAKAHILALQHLGSGNCSKVYNLGNGAGYSVLEIIEAARKVTGASIPVVLRPQRTGDPPVLVAGSELARSELGWEPEFADIDSIIDSAWRWHKQNPHGYSE